MKVLLVNKFNFLQGGADKYFLELADLLRQNGTEVVKFCMDHPKNLPDENSEFFVSYVDIKKKGLANKLRYALRFFYSFEAKRKFEALLEKTKPDIIHIHNIYHQISPSILDVTKKYKIPVVMHLHDYKLISPNYTMFYRKGIDDSAVGGHYYRCALKRSFKNSFFLSLLVSLEMFLHHTILKIYEKTISWYIAPSHFMRDTVAAAGFDSKKIVVIPNFVNGIEKVEPKYQPGNYFLFFGRLSAEKGVDKLLEALAKTNEQLKIIGDGDERTKLESLAAKLQLNSRVEFLGARFGTELAELIRAARAVVVPSVWYEVFGIVNIEAGAFGKPVIAADIGGIRDSVIADETALLYQYDSVDALAKRINELASNDKRCEELGKAAHEFVTTHFNSSAHLPQILSVYEKALGR